MSNDLVLNSKSCYDPETKIWTGPQTPLKYGPNETIGKVVLETLLKDPQHISQICHHNGKTYSNLEMATYSIRVAQHLEELGLKENDIIGICAAHSDFLAPLVFGAMLQGCVISTLDPLFEKAGIKNIYSMTRPKVMFCDGSNFGKIKEAFLEMDLKSEIYTMQDHLPEVKEITEFLTETGKEKDFKAKTLSQEGDQMAAILCSSGTTGLPKGICLSNVALLNATFIPFSEGETTVCFSNLYWFSGLVTLLQTTIKQGTRVIHSKGFSPKAFLEIIENYKVSSVFAPPSHIALTMACKEINNYDLSSLRVFFTGGSAIPFPFVEQSQQLVPQCKIVAAYGMSEVSGPISVGIINSAGSNGPLVAGMQAKIVDSSGETLEPGEVGEFWLKSCFKWPGYFNKPEATKEIYDEDGWIRSGDLGYINENGELFVIDRIKDIMRCNGYDSSPTEIEKVICEMPGVSEVSVCGIPDMVSTNLPAAAVVKVADSDLTEKDVCDYVAQRLESFKQLKGGVYFVESLPKTPAGKVPRREVLKICEELRSLKVK